MPRKSKPLSALEVGRLTSKGFYAVGTVPGLHMLVSEAGGRSWILRILVGGKRRDIGLGGYPAVTLADAHRLAREARESVRNGNDPVLARAQARSTLIAQQASAVMFDRAIELFLDAKGDEWRNAKHRAQWKSTLITYASPLIGKMFVTDVRSADVLKVLEPIWRTKHETASRLRGRIEAVLSYAMQAGYRPTGLNPARWKGNLDMLLPRISKVAVIEHFPALPFDQLGRFIESLRSAHGLAARAVELAILCASRSGEVRGATWAEFDLAAGIWTIPAGRMKAQREHRVPLSPAALDLIRSLPRIQNADLLFPSTRKTQLSDMAMTAVTRRLHEVDRKTGGPGFTDPKRDDRVITVHGFRSTFRDWASETTAYPSEVVEMCLAHAIGNKVEAAYRRGDLFEKRRRLMNEWATFCDQPSAARKSATVHTISA